MACITKRPEYTVLMITPNGAGPDSFEVVRGIECLTDRACRYPVICGFVFEPASVNVTSSTDMEGFHLVAP